MPVCAGVVHKSSQFSDHAPKYEDVERCWATESVGTREPKHVVGADFVVQIVSQSRERMAATSNTEQETRRSSTDVKMDSPMTIPWSRNCLFCY